MVNCVSKDFDLQHELCIVRVTQCVAYRDKNVNLTRAGVQGLRRLGLHVPNTMHLLVSGKIVISKQSS